VALSDPSRTDEDHVLMLVDECESSNSVNLRLGRPACSDKSNDSTVLMTGNFALTIVCARRFHDASRASPASSSDNRCGRLSLRQVAYTDRAWWKAVTGIRAGRPKVRPGGQFLPAAKGSISRCRFHLSEPNALAKRLQGIPIKRISFGFDVCAVSRGFMAVLIVVVVLLGIFGVLRLLVSREYDLFKNDHPGHWL
jgi:hypothetical protein